VRNDVPQRIAKQMAEVHPVVAAPAA